MPLYQSLAGWVGDKPWFRPVASRVLPRLDAALLRARGWRATPFATLLLTTTGRRSSEPHHSPLYYLEDGGYVVIASNYGGAEPDWSRNLAPHPTCTVKVGRVTAAAQAQRVSEQEWPGYLDQFAAFYPAYRDYVARAGRDIPMWKLVPLPAAP